MEAVYTFKKLQHYKPFDNTFFRLAKLSIHSAKQFYSTVLYTDDKSLKFLSAGGLVFDRVVLLDSIAEYKGNNYALPKILTMIERKDPYIHLDFDSILIDKPESKEPVSFPFPEPNLKMLDTHNPYEFIYKSYVKCFVEHIMDKIDYEKQKILVWDVFCNNSALLVNTPEIVSEIYSEIINDFIPDKIEAIVPTAIEQQYLLSFLHHYNISYDFREDTDKFKVIDYKNKTQKEKKFYLTNLKYLHFGQYDWWPQITNEVLDFFENKLKYKHTKEIL